MPNKNLSNEALGYEGLNFESILRECLVCGLFIVTDGKISFITPEAEQHLHLTQLTSQPITALPTPLQLLIREAQQGAVITNRQIVLPQKKAEGISLSVTAMPLPDSSKRSIVLVALQNISSVEKLERKLQRLDRLAGIGTLSASMAHEMRNALVPLRTFIDLLLEKHRDSELAETVRRETARMDSIVSQMLKFAAPARPTLAAVHLHKMLEHSLRLAEHRVASKIITFKKEFRAAPDSLEGDEQQLEQAFVNLFINAIEAMGAEGTLTITTELATEETSTPALREGASAKQLRVHITDTGVGIAPEHLAQIFTPFFTTKQQGTGLGLPVTRRIIEEHQGSIRVESQPGKGTTFIVELPTGGKTHSR